MDNNLTTQPTGLQSRPPKPLRLKPKQKQTIKNWVDPTSNTYGNLYQSAVKAGFRPSYALNLTHLNPTWLSETIDSTQLNPEHVRQGIIHIATKENINSRSPDDTRLNAYTQLGKYLGMEKNDNNVRITVVQPILGGASVAPNKVVIDQDPSE